EASNNGLRGLAQGAERMLESIGSAPPALLQAATGIAGVGGAGLLAFGGVTRMATGAVQLQEALGRLSERAPRAASGLETAGAAAAGLLVLFTAAAALEEYGKAQQDLEFSSLRLTKALLGPKDQVENLNDLFQLSAPQFRGFGV